MRYFIDTEFIEDGKTIELLSIGIKASDGREFYAEVQDAPFDKADQWVKDNVIAHLWHRQADKATFNAWSRDGAQGGLMRKDEVAAAVRRFIGGDKEPQFFAYYADYDWVVFCQLFGRMIDLPKHFPMFCIDLKQMMWERGLTKENFNVKELLPQENEHNALDDALWNKLLYDAINHYPISPPPPHRGE